MVWQNTDPIAGLGNICQLGKEAEIVVTIITQTQEESSGQSQIDMVYKYGLLKFKRGKDGNFSFSP